MKILTAEGNIVEGQQLTNEQSGILAELTCAEGPLSEMYSTRMRMVAAAKMFALYTIERRVPFDPTAEHFPPNSEVA